MSRNITEFLNSKKVELSSNRIELGLAEDIAKEISNANSDIKNYLQSATSISTLASKAATSGDAYVKTAVKIDKIMTTMKVKATELGLKAEDIKGYKEAEDLLVRYDPSAVQSKVADFKKL